MKNSNALSPMSQPFSTSFRRLTFGLVTAALTMGPAALSAQVASEEEAGLVDRIVAVVGDSAIFLSQVEEELMLRAAGQVPTDPDSLRVAQREMLDQLINLQLILKEAALDSTLSPSEDAIEAAVSQRVTEVQAAFASVQEFNARLANDGMTVASYRATLRRRLVEEAIQDLFLQRRLAAGSPVAVTEPEMRQYFADNEARLENRPELLSLEQIILRPGASDEAWATKKALADSLVAVLRAGGDFEALAISFSEDPGSGALGGELPWFRRGDMLTSFEEAAFRLPDLRVSDPVRSAVGWHIIRVDRRRPGELKARHILLMPATSAGDVVRTTELGDSVANMIRDGRSVAELRTQYGDPDQSGALTITREQANQGMPEGYARALANVTDGQVVGPFQSRLLDRPIIVVIRIDEVRPPGRLTFEDVRDEIRRQLQNQKRLERLWESLRANTYVDIRF